MRLNVEEILFVIATNEIDRGQLEEWCFLRSMVKQVDKCIEMDGRHFKHLL